MRLRDIGEFALLREYIFPALRITTPPSGVGDDCAYLPISAGTELVVTMDKVPRPFLALLDDSPYWTWGWFSAAINLSDLAAAGCTPVAFLSSVSASPDMQVEDLSQFFAGVSACCAKYEVWTAGGNVSGGESLECHGTAIGTATSGRRLRRTGCLPGHFLIAVGECGVVMSSYLQARRDGLASLAPDLRTRLVAPAVQIREMRLLHERGLVSAASDNSDGLLGAIFNILEASSCAALLDLDRISVSPVVLEAGATYGVDLWNLFFCYGDWQVVVAVPPDQLGEFRRMTSEHSISYVELGRAVQGSPSISATHHGVCRSAQIVRNEHFRAQSFSASAQADINSMLNAEIFTT